MTRQWTKKRDGRYTRRDNNKLVQGKEKEKNVMDVKGIQFAVFYLLSVFYYYHF